MTVPGGAPSAPTGDMASTIAIGEEKDTASEAAATEAIERDCLELLCVPLIPPNLMKRENIEDKADQWVEVIAWEPQAVIYHNFLSQDECNHLINLAKPNMEKSTVVDNETGKSVDSRVRTGSGTFLARENGEGLQLLHYEVGQKYEPHYDYFLDHFNAKNGGQRLATVLMYLGNYGGTLGASALAKGLEGNKALRKLRMLVHCHALLLSESIYVTTKIRGPQSYLLEKALEVTVGDYVDQYLQVLEKLKQGLEIAMCSSADRNASLQAFEKLELGSLLSKIVKSD
ncbi:hypothetical protein L2E82_13445 [Cichorium intybus]|uniref:Uncharacterized protein n=1 Tax=Cichorium intybus TaxID=13427 RepID=A0ACB9EXS3_CICIN|nr:hypothetical protein L2E82_13445 [Cichorium intybus]